MRKLRRIIIKLWVGLMLEFKTMDNDIKSLIQKQFS